MYDQRDSLNSSKDEYKYKLTKKGNNRYYVNIYYQNT